MIILLLDVFVIVLSSRREFIIGLFIISCKCLLLGNFKGFCYICECIILDINNETNYYIHEFC